MPASSALAVRAATAPRPRPAGQTDLQRRPQPICGPHSPDEVIVAVALTTRWMLITGRRLDQRPALHHLSSDQLITFWADDHLDGLITISQETGNA